jgi:hypothetical protein
MKKRTKEESVITDELHSYRMGMMRDWFAGLAMQGLIATDLGFPNKNVVINAYEIADAMIAERTKENE